MKTKSMMLLGCLAIFVLSSVGMGQTDVAESVARTISNDGGLTLLFTAKGEIHRCRYEHDNEGLVLAPVN